MPAWIRLHHAIDIAAAPARVAACMLSAESYRQWTAVFAEGSRVIGGWQPGERMRFMAGTGQGMLSEVVEHRPLASVVLRHLGMIEPGRPEPDGHILTDAWTGAQEIYRFEATPQGTRLRIEQDAVADAVAYLQDTWPAALQRLKALCEAPS